MILHTYKVSVGRRNKGFGKEWQEPVFNQPWKI